MRMLDSLLVVHGETARSFRMGLGVGLVHPVPAALEMCGPRIEWSEKAAAPMAPHGWLFHLDARNVMATYWSPLLLSGRVGGYRVRLMETEGRGTRVGIRSFQSIHAARKVDWASSQPAELETDGDKVTLDLRPYEWVQVEADFVNVEKQTDHSPQ
jgi:alpha-mannosidase